MKEALIAQLEALLGQDDFKQIRNEIGSVIQDFKKTVRQEREGHLQAFKDAGGNPDEFVDSSDEFDEKFEALMVTYNAKKEIFQKEREEADARRAELQKQRETENKRKMDEQEALIKELAVLVESGDQSNEVFQQFKDLQAKWKEIGRVNSDTERAKTLMSDYNHQLDLFRYNRKIAFDLLELDFRKNLAAKELLLSKVEKILESENINEVASHIQQYQTEWKHTGPVPREYRDEINARFKELSDTIFQKIGVYYETRREQLQHNLESKKTLIDQVKEVIDGDLSTHEIIEAKTKDVLQLQEAWKNIGYSSQNDEMWHTFRDICDSFFERKKSFYRELDSQREARKLQKTALAEQAEAMQHSTEWNITSGALVKLQEEWKKVGPVSKGDENRLWKRFRSACDKFFSAKKEHFSQQDSNQDSNLTLKKDLIARIAAHEFSEDTEEGFDALRAYADEWNNIGLVPIKEKNNIYAAYKKALDAKYAELKKLRDERRTQRPKGDYGRRTEQPTRYYDKNERGTPSNKEDDRLRSRIEQLEQDILQYENNLGFFAAKSGSKNPLIKDVEEKVAKLKSEVRELRLRLQAAVAAPVVVETTPPPAADVTEANSDNDAEETVMLTPSTEDMVAQSDEVIAEAAKLTDSESDVTDANN